VITKYKFLDNEGIYFISFATVSWRLFRYKRGLGCWNII